MRRLQMRSAMAACMGRGAGGDHRNGQARSGRGHAAAVRGTLKCANLIASLARGLTVAQI